MRASSVAVALALVLAHGRARAQSHVSCVGDSITYGDGTSDRATKSYPAVLAALLGAGYAVENDGHSGATMLKSGDLPYWTTAEYGTSTTWAAAGGDVVIQLGTNDSKPKNWTGKASFVADCEALVDHYRAASSSTRVWISLIPPATAGACCKIDGTVIDDEIVPLLGQCAAAKGATTIDVHSALAAHTDWLTDGVHPNDSGAALLAQTVYAALAKLPTIDLVAGDPTTPAPATVTLTASPVAAYGKVEKVRFLEGTTVVGEATAPPWTVAVANVGAGAHSFSAELTETAGRTATSAPASAIVAPPPPGSPDGSTGPDPDASGSSPGGGSSGAGPGSSGAPASGGASSTSSGGDAPERSDPSAAPGASSGSGCASAGHTADRGALAPFALALAVAFGSAFGKRARGRDA